ncbi:uncharacterized protein LOC134293715 [Anolis carolinensis]|uniref:uncharacterized protein LOC134293715 n=1 Tax=Anolis carolinensis TaxID=28377 RepID=UPI002F2B21AD
MSALYGHLYKAALHGKWKTHGQESQGIPEYWSYYGNSGFSYFTSKVFRVTPTLKKESLGRNPVQSFHRSLRFGENDYIVISILFMLISAVTCYGSVIFGTLCLTALPPSKKIKWTTLTITLCFVSGFTGGIGLFNFMRLSTEEPNTFLSWSLAPGWFSVIIVLFAGVCHFVARNWEEEELAQTLLGTTVVFTLQEDCVARAASEEAQQKRKRLPESDTSA